MQTREERTYQAVIGLEFHVHLATATRMFCGCRVVYGDEPSMAVVFGLLGEGSL